MTTPSNKSCERLCNVASNIQSTRDLENSVGDLNLILRGLGRIERSPYVVLEEPALVKALDFFRRSACDVDWVKRQVHGERLIYVPENFPRDIVTPEEVVRRCEKQKL